VKECFSTCTHSRRTALKGRKKDAIGAGGMEEGERRKAKVRKAFERLRIGVEG
jgi:hypothetical protein